MPMTDAKREIANVDNRFRRVWHLQTRNTQSNDDSIRISADRLHHDHNLHFVPQNRYLTESMSPATI